MGKPISGDKCISLAAENPLATENACPLIGNLSLKTSLEFHLFFLTIFWVLCADQTQIIQSPTQICSSSVLRCQIVPLFVVKSFLCSSSSNCWFFFSSAVVQVPKSSLRDSVLLFRTQVLKTRDLCCIFCPTHPAQILAKRVFETRVLI